MKTGLLITVFVIAVIGIYFLFFNKTPNADAVKKVKPVPLAISKNPDAFNTAFANMLNGYYSLKDALVNWDSAKAGNDATTLAALAKSVPYDLVKADKNIVLTAKNFSDAIAAESDNLNKAKTIEKQRRSFTTISDNLYSLLNTVRYDKEVIYHDMCPMAFGDDEQAYWLSKDIAISNPYLGNKHPKYKSGMVTCGSVEDSVTFAGK